MNQVRIMELRGTYKGGGGPDKTILLSAARHNEKKFFVLVTYLRDPNDSEFQIGEMARSMGVRDYVEVFDRSMLDFRCLFEVNRLVRENRIQIIHVHDTKTTLLGFLLKALNPKVKIMHTAHGWIIDSNVAVLKQKLQLLMLRFYPLHIAVSKATMEFMVESGIDPLTIKVLYNSIDAEYWRRDGAESTLRDEYGISPEGIIIGTVGRLSNEKDLPTFLKVARNILKVYPDTKFLVVGDGKNGIVEHLRDLARKMDIERSIIFMGHRTDLKNIYSSFDLFLTTSLTEGLPNTVLEAMALEVPVVATNVGGMPELVEDGKTGILCNTVDVERLTNSVVSLLSDPGKMRELAINARERVEEKFSFGTRLKDIEGYYKLIANKA